MRYDQRAALEEKQQKSSRSGVNYLIPKKLKLVQEPFGANETVPFTIQPKLVMLDAIGSVVTSLGHASSSWYVTASLRNGSGDARAVLEGNVTIAFVNGWANFTGLSVTHNASDYVLDFNITRPSTNQFNTSSQPFEVKERVLYCSLAMHPLGANETVPFVRQPLIEFRDVATGDIVVNTGWKGRQWLVSASISNSTANSGYLNGTSEVAFVEGISTFDNLSISHAGTDYVLKLQARTIPASRYSCSLKTDSFNVTERVLYLKVVQHPDNCNDTVVCGNQPILEIRNTFPDELAGNIGWRRRTWVITASMVGANNSVINGSSALTVPESGRVEFTDIKFFDLATGIVSYKLTPKQIFFFSQKTFYISKLTPNSA